MQRFITILSSSFIPVFILIFASQASAQTATAGQLIISEFRVRGPNGANDEFIEIYNASGADHTVTSLSGTGYGIAASNGVTRCSIPNGTVIPNRGHYLCVNSVGYSLASYPAGSGTTATGDATYTSDIPDNAGITLFNNNTGGGSYSLANRLDAVGSTSEVNTLYKEGTGYPALTPFSIDYSFYRDACGKGGSITTFNHCVLDGPKDTNNNAADFVFVDTNGTSAGAGQRLGAPGPENLSSPVLPIQSLPGVVVRPMDTCVSRFNTPNAVRDFTSDPPNNSTFGTIELRFKVTNLTGQSSSKLRLRIIDLTTFPAPAGIADLRPRTSTDVVVTADNAPCGSNSNVLVKGTTLEQSPSQPNGGGYNSTMGASHVSLATPLANGDSTYVRILMGIQQNGSFKLGFAAETSAGSGSVYYVEGVTNSLAPFTYPTAFDFSNDHKSEIAIFRASTGQWWQRRSSDGAVSVTTFGSATDETMPGDYTGDGIEDRAVYRASTGQWFVLRSENNSFYAVPFGVSSDVPVNGDFDGDGRMDHAVFRPSEAKWYIRSSATGSTAVIPWGVASDMPVPADYDGDRKTDIAIWRPNGIGGGEWWVRYSSGGHASLQFGAATDKALPGDYTGDGRADIALWRPSTGQWFVLRSQDFSYYAVPFGVSTDVPVPADYDGDNKFDLAVFRPETSTWYISNSGGSPTTILPFGLNTDQPLPNTYVK